jgi:short-subunit dehydrogenase
MEKTKDTALVTGASGGIGLELAKLLAARGLDLIVVARNEDKLRAPAEELKSKHGTEVTVVAADLSRPQSVPELVHSITVRGHQVHVLVNNAGYGLAGAFSETDGQRELDMIQLNITSLVHLTKFLVPDMVAHKHGRILNVASTAGYVPGPLMAVYYASKAFVLSFSEALAEELKGTGVTCTALCPGATETGFAARAKTAGTRLFKSNPVMTAEEVAVAGVNGMFKGRVHVIPGLRNKVLVHSSRLATRGLQAKIAKALNSTAA